MKSIKLTKAGIIIVLLNCFATLNGIAQVISRFSWSSGSVTAASVGISATSSSSTAVISSGGSNGNGLNPGLPKTNFNMIIPGSSAFDVDGIDIQLDYQRDEATANFFERGSSIAFVMTTGNLSISYRVSDGAGSYTTVSSGNIYTVPNDNVFRTYRFIYTPLTGLGEVFVNGVTKWSNNGTDNRNMYWTGSGNISIGSLMNGGGGNKACLDELIISRVANTLPVELTQFTAIAENKNVTLRWTTSSEVNNDFVTIDKSPDGIEWEELDKAQGAGNSSNLIEYSFVDNTITTKKNYYRLSQTDYDGKSVIKGIQYIEMNISKLDIKVFPNPARDHLIIQRVSETVFNLFVFDSMYQRIQLPFVEMDECISLNTEALKSGIYYLTIESNSGRRNLKFEKL